MFQHSTCLLDLDKDKELGNQAAQCTMCKPSSSVSSTGGIKPSGNGMSAAETICQMHVSRGWSRTDQPVTVIRKLVSRPRIVDHIQQIRISYLGVMQGDRHPVRQMDERRALGHCRSALGCNLGSLNCCDQICKPN